ncbi:MAG: secretin and TonB N-terminal domain-containing protein, partial [Oscillospiraceae bacterium]
MEFKLYRCAHCGNIVFKIVDSGVPVICCGEPMGELTPNITDGAVEKHVPDVKREGDDVTIQIGSTIHPMIDTHYIQMIAAVTGDTVTGTMTLRLKDVPWDQALDIVLQQKGLAKRQVGNVIRIAPQADMI